jgi:thioredoxin reductase (NADPH)
MRQVIIAGGGPAGLTAGLYLGRALEKPLLLERMMPGGQLAMTTDIENYPGFSKPVQSYELIAEMVSQAERFGCEIVTDEEITKLSRLQGGFELTTASGRKEQSETIILALGASPKTLGAPGEAEFTGRGVSYCAVCDGALYRDREVAVVGGGDSALTEALFLTRFASKVTIIHRRDKFRGVKSLADRVLAHEKIKVVWNSRIERIVGKEDVEKIVLGFTDNSRESAELAVEGVFIFVGYIPNTSFLEGEFKEILDEQGYVIADNEMRTSIPGLFACGDVIRKSLKQVVTAASDGAVAAKSVCDYLEHI